METELVEDGLGVRSDVSKVGSKSEDWPIVADGAVVRISGVGKVSRTHEVAAYSGVGAGLVRELARGFSGIVPAGYCMSMLYLHR